MVVVFFGDVVGRIGRRALAVAIQSLRRGGRIDLVIANCENASGGKGIDPGAAEELYDSGVDVLTSGNHVWQHSSIVSYIHEEPRLLRPLNFPRSSPGRGWTVARIKDGGGVAVINLIGRAFMGPAECPFDAVSRVVDEVRASARAVVVDMHAEATSEKVAMGRFLDGRVSAVVGTHTHVQTADACVLPKGTAYITDVGMCGPENSVLGMRTDQVLRRFMTQMPVRFEVATGPALACGVRITLDDASGRAGAIEVLRLRVE